MALKVKAVERKIKFTKDENDPGVYRYVMSPELYIALSQAKVIREAALRSGVSQGVMKACWDAAGEVIKAWATEGHSVALPGLGTMRFGLRAKSVEKVEDVKTGLISSRRIIFTPTQEPSRIPRARAQRVPTLRAAALTTPRLATTRRAVAVTTPVVATAPSRRARATDLGNSETTEAQRHREFCAEIQIKLCDSVSLW